MNTWQHVCPRHSLSRIIMQKIELVAFLVTDDEVTSGSYDSGIEEDEYEEEVYNFDDDDDWSAGQGTKPPNPA